MHVLAVVCITVTGPRPGTGGSAARLHAWADTRARTNLLQQLWTLFPFFLPSSQQ